MPINYTPEMSENERRKFPRTSARDIMTANIISVDPDMNVYDAVEVLLKNDVTGVPVVDSKGNHVGMLSEKDCLKRMLSDLYYTMPDEKVQNYMSKVIYSIDIDMDFFMIVRIFVETQYRRLPVLENGKLVGQISRKDCLLAMQKIKNIK